MARNPRVVVADQLKKLKNSRAKSFAGFLRQDADLGLTPCWGAIAKRFEREFTSTEERLVIWRELLSLGERGPLLLFIKNNLARSDVLRQVVEDAASLPESLQCVLACLDEAHGLLEPKVQALCAAAQQLWVADEDTKRRERAHFESLVAKMLAIDYVLPAQST